MQHQVIALRAGLVELRAHRRVLELQRLARRRPARARRPAPDERGSVRERARRSGRRRRPVVVVRELRRRERRPDARRCRRTSCPSKFTISGVMSASIVDRAGSARAGVRIGADHVVAVGDAVVRVGRCAVPVRDRARWSAHDGRTAVHGRRRRFQRRVVDRVAARRSPCRRRRYLRRSLRKRLGDGRRSRRARTRRSERQRACETDARLKPLCL